MTEPLKPCPFCDGDATLGAWSAVGSDESTYEVTCVGCGASSYACSTPQEAAERWNLRVDEES